MDIISVPMGWILKHLCNFCGGNFAVSIMLFTIVVNLLMLPLTIKTQVTQSKQARLKPKLDAIKKKCGDDRQKYSQEMSELYTREGVSMGGGCLPMLIRMFFITGVYSVVMNPLRYMMGIDSSVVQTALTENSLNRAIDLIPLINAEQIAAIPSSMIEGYSFNLFGLDLAQFPNFSWNIAKGWQPIWIIPIISFLTSLASGFLSSKMQKKMNPDSPNMMGLMLVMPIFSLWLAFTVPGAVGFYWICSNVVMTGLQIAVQLIYNPSRIIANEQAREIIKQAQVESQKISKIADSSADVDKE